MSSLKRHIDRTLVIFGTRLQICAICNENLDHLAIPRLGRPVESRPAAMLLSIDVRSALRKRFDVLRFAACYCGVERSIRHSVTRPRIDRRAPIQKRADQIWRRKEGRKV